MNTRIRITTKDGPREADLRDDGAYWVDNGVKFLHVDPGGVDSPIALRDAGYAVALDDLKGGEDPV